jgi:hypothetical protein
MNNNQDKREKNMINVSPETAFLIVTLVLFIPLILSGFLFQ